MATPCEISHGWSPFYFSIRGIVNSALLSLCLSCLPPGTWKSHLCFPPSNWSMASLVTDQEPIGEQNLSIRTTSTFSPTFSISFPVTSVSYYPLSILEISLPWSHFYFLFSVVTLGYRILCKVSELEYTNRNHL